MNNSNSRRLLSLGEDMAHPPVRVQQAVQGQDLHHLNHCSERGATLADELHHRHDGRFLGGKGSGHRGVAKMGQSRAFLQ